MILFFPLILYSLEGVSILLPTILCFSPCKNWHPLCCLLITVEKWHFLISMKRLSFSINSLIVSSSIPIIDSISFYHVGFPCLQVTFLAFHSIFSVGTQSGFRRRGWLLDLWFWKQSLFQIYLSFLIHTLQFFLKGIKQQNCCFHIVVKQ